MIGYRGSSRSRNAAFVCSFLLLLSTLWVASGTRTSVFFNTWMNKHSKTSGLIYRKFKPLAKDCQTKSSSAGSCSGLSPAERDKIFGADKRLIPTGPNPLHNSFQRTVVINPGLHCFFSRGWLKMFNRPISADLDPVKQLTTVKIVMAYCKRALLNLILFVWSEIREDENIGSEMQVAAKLEY
eukprot:Gb_27680 [translate_table: standard]